MKLISNLDIIHVSYSFGDICTKVSFTDIYNFSNFNTIFNRENPIIIDYLFQIMKVESFLSECTFF